MGGAASAAAAYAANEENEMGPNIYPSLHFDQGMRNSKHWTNREILMDNDALYVKSADKKDKEDREDPCGTDPRVTPSLLVYSLHRDVGITVDRSDESRLPVLVLRQDSHVLCIKMKSDFMLDSFRMRINEVIMTNEAKASDSKAHGLVKMFQLFEDVIEETAQQTDAGEDEKSTLSVETMKKKIFDNVKTPPPKMNVVIMVVGTRGDIQPFIYLGQALQKYGHRVRLATHTDYRQDVTTNGGLEFYPLAGDPKLLSSYMVKTGGRLLPDLLNEEERRELPEKMKMIKDITYSTWPACTAVDPGDSQERKFLADAIISNPVTYGHIHCAEALCIPLVCNRYF